MTTKESAIKMLRQVPRPTRAAVARQLGVPTTTVQYWATAAGMSPGKRGRPKALPRHSYRLADSVHTTALDRLDERGIDGVADLLEGLADGTIRIILD